MSEKTAFFCIKFSFFVSLNMKKLVVSKTYKKAVKNISKNNLKKDLEQQKILGTRINSMLF
jgi:hypothetical protein